MENEDNVITPIQDKRDLVDKTIDTYDTLVDTKEHNGEFTKEEENKYKNIAVFCYIPFICLYFIVTGEYKKSEYLKFHVNEGIDLTLAFIIIVIINKICNAIFNQNSLVLHNTPFIIDAVISFLYFCIILLMLFGILNTVNYKSKELPIIGKIKLIK